MTLETQEDTDVKMEYKLNASIIVCFPVYFLMYIMLYDFLERDRGNTIINVQLILLLEVLQKLA